MSVAAFDDVEEAALAFPALTTLNSGRTWIADTAVQRLADHLQRGDSDARVIVAQHSVIERASV